MKNISILPTGSVTTPKGFKSSGIKCGLKASGNPDMALIFSETNAVCAGTFTDNLFAAAPVKWCKKILARSGSAGAVIINSGNANACTGEEGDKRAEEMAEKTAALLNIAPYEVFVASTGRIGVQLPMDKINKGITLAVENLSADGGHNSAQAIMTTDTLPKEVAVQFLCEDKYVTLAGMVKGAGMIAPGMSLFPHATMLAFMTTDANVSRGFLESALDAAVKKSFNRITVDGDMSTNDTVLIMANAKSETRLLDGSCMQSRLFAEALEYVASELARKIVLDGEGATKFVTVNILGAASAQDAEKCAKAIANSLLCKTAWFGGDPNWGRVIAAAGYSGAAFDPSAVSLFYDDKIVVKNGQDSGIPETELAEIINKKEFSITVDLNSGIYEFSVWTSDISYEYVKINADYHT